MDFGKTEQGLVEVWEAHTAAEGPMKSLLLSGVALIALAAGPAMAADLAKPLYKAPPPAPPPRGSGPGLKARNPGRNKC
jgi:hypothetical protein